jgi:hypothetical protein
MYPIYLLIVASSTRESSLMLSSASKVGKLYLIYFTIVAN